MSGDTTTGKDANYGIGKTNTALTHQLMDFIVSKADPKELLDQVYPEGEFPLKIDNLFYGVNDSQLRGQRASKLKKSCLLEYMNGVWKCFPVMASNGKNEINLAKFLNGVASSCKSIFPKKPSYKCVWVGVYSTYPVSGGHTSLKRKPDLVLLNMQKG